MLCARRMNAVAAFGLNPEVAAPRELVALFEELPRARVTFARLPERERRGLVAYVAEPRLREIRERRAALVMDSLASLADAQA